MTAIYCLKCKTKTSTSGLYGDVSSNNKNMIKGNCSVCGSKKASFISAANIEGEGIGNLFKSVGKFAVKAGKKTGRFASKPENLVNTLNTATKLGSIAANAYTNPASLANPSTLNTLKDSYNLGKTFAGSGVKAKKPRKKRTPKN